MKKTLIAAAVMAASGVAFAASNVTLYGVIEEGVVLEKAKHGDTLVKLQSGFDQGSRWGIKVLKTSETVTQLVLSSNRDLMRTAVTKALQEKLSAVNLSFT
jgi:hypothetical protein